MKKLVNAPLTNRIFWATVNEKQGTMNPQTRIDVTDNAIDCVFYHFTDMDSFKNTGFSGYEIPKVNNTEETAVICAYDTSKHICISKNLYEELLEYKEMYKDLCK